MLVSRGTFAKAVAVFAAVALMAVIWLPFGIPFAPNDSSSLDFWFGLHGKDTVTDGDGWFLIEACPEGDDGDNDPDAPPPPPGG